MNAYGITPFSFNLIIQVLTRYIEIEEAILFGSRAKATHIPGSDIDIAIKGKACSEALAWTVHAELNERQPIPYFIDVVYYEGISNPALKVHIDRVGKVIYRRQAASVI